MNSQNGSSFGLVEPCASLIFWVVCMLEELLKS